MIAAAAVFPETDDGNDGADDAHPDEQLMIVLDQIAPMAAQYGAGPDEKQCPGNGADNRKQYEPAEGIAGDAGREGNERPHTGQAAADDDGNAAVLIEHLFGHIEFLFIEENIFAVFQEQRRPPYEPSQ